MSNTFAEAVETTEQVVLGENGMPTLSSSLNKNVDLFFAIGASRGKDITDLYEGAYQENRETAVRCLMWARDIRGGAGERQTFRNLLKYLEKVHPNTLLQVLPKIPEYGRWDDLLVFERDFIREQAFDLIKNALDDGNGLAAKWMPRKGKLAHAMRNHFGMTPKQYRKTLVNLSKTVEQQMCAKDWENINYSHVPSVAASRYQNAFNRHDPDGYSAYREGLIRNDGSVKINASAIYPYDVIKGMNKGDLDVSIAQWDALPDYLGDNAILPMVDVSSSMTCSAGGSSTTCMDVAISLGLYIADKQKGPFRNQIMTFSANPVLQSLTGTIYEKYTQLRRADWGMNTNLLAAFDRILEVATSNNIDQSQMPKYLLILSDMQFDEATGSSYSWGARGGSVPTMDAGAFAQARSKFEKAGYELPTIVFWNLNARGNQAPVSYNENGVCLVSGFSPSIVESVLKAQKITPEGIMIDALYGPRYDGIVY